MAFRTIDELEAALRKADYLPDRGLATALFLSLALEKPVLLEGEAGVGKTEAAKALATRSRRAADPPPVLRGARRLARRLRVELPAPAPPHPRRAGGHGLRGGALRPRVPHPAAAARGDRLRRAGRAAHRRDRSRGRGVRGVPARGPLGLPDHDPGARHDPRAAQAGGRPHLEPHARAARRAQAARALPLDRASVDRARGRDRPAARPRRFRSVSRRRRPRSSAGCAGSTSRSRPALPRRSTGRRRSPRSAGRRSTPRSSSRRSARC